MSIFSKVAGFFKGTVTSVIDGAKDAWGAISTVWAFLVSISSIVDEAWTWVVNGVGWFTGTLEGWAAEVFNGFSHILFGVIPHAIEWALKEANRLRNLAIRVVDEALRGLIHSIRVWAEHELGKLEAKVVGLFHSIISWATGPIKWVLNEGKRLYTLVMHPEILARWIVGALIVPLIQWLLTSSVPVLTWLFHDFVENEAEAAALLEDLLDKVL